MRKLLLVLCVSGLMIGCGDDAGVTVDKEYQAGSGLTLDDGTTPPTFSVDFVGTGAAASSSRSDHDHEADHYTEAEADTLLASKANVAALSDNNPATVPVNWADLTNVPLGFSSLDGVTPTAGDIDLIAGTGVVITPNDTDNEITIAVNIGNGAGQVAPGIHGAHVVVLDDLTDVDAASVGAGEVLSFDGTSWVNLTAVGAGLAPVGHDHVDELWDAPAESCFGVSDEMTGTEVLLGDSSGYGIVPAGIAGLTYSPGAVAVLGLEADTSAVGILGAPAAAFEELDLDLAAGVAGIAGVDGPLGAVAVLGAEMSDGTIGILGAPAGGLPIPDLAAGVAGVTGEDSSPDAVAVLGLNMADGTFGVLGAPTGFIPDVPSPAGVVGVDMTGAGIGVYGYSMGGGFAGFFEGDVQVVGALDATDALTQNGTAVSLTGHGHDPSYYTETELNTAGSGAQVDFGNLTNVPADNDTQLTEADVEGYIMNGMVGPIVNAGMESWLAVGLGTLVTDVILAASPVVPPPAAQLLGPYAVVGNDTSGAGIGVYGRSPVVGTGYAGYFDGNVHVNGSLSKAAGTFKIDHPLQPDRKYLYHSFVESPDMMNVYNGNVVLSDAGTATVTLPDYFEVLNREFRYQITCVGGFAPVYIAEKISKNMFKIAGGTAGLEVSWQVTGVRQDAYAKAHRIVVEVDKPDHLVGYYLTPTEHGQPAEKSERYAPRDYASK